MSNNRTTRIPEMMCARVCVKVSSVSIKLLANEVKVGKHTIRDILSIDSNKQKVFGRFMTQTLTDERKLAKVYRYFQDIIKI